MLSIRLASGGAKKRPFYHVVVTDSRNPRDGKHLERIGYFNPIACGGETRLLIEKERLLDWQKKGAQASERVQKLIKEFDKGLTQPKPIKQSKPMPAKVAPKAEAAETSEAAPTESDEKPSETNAAEANESKDA